MRNLVICAAILILASGCSQAQTPAEVVDEGSETREEDQDSASAAQQEASAPDTVAAPGESLITYLHSSDLGDIAIKINVPETARYEEGAGIVVNIATYFTPINGFYEDLDATVLGLIHISYLWPGTSDPSGASSDGVFDYGGPISIQALREILLFATGAIPNRDGHFLGDLIAITPLTQNVGLYAFSHPGIAAVNVLADYGGELQNVKYFVGRENPTTDMLSAVELGYFDENNRPIPNPLYQYPDSYQPTGFNIEFDSIQWDPVYSEGNSRFEGRPYFDLNGNGVLDEGDHVLGSRVPTMFGKRFYSIQLTRALRDNGAISPDSWPEDLAAPEETVSTWPYQNSLERYQDLAQEIPELHIMLVFAGRDHVQPALDKPHIHQAFDGMHHSAGLWTRLNPDESYVSWIAPELEGAYQEQPANSEPDDWNDATAWGYGGFPGGSTLIPLAAVAEMADRAYFNIWDADLDSLLVDASAPALP